MPTLKPEIKDAWIEALESGRYKQGVGVLHNATKNQYCCLGVLCDLAVQANVIPVPEAVNNGQYSDIIFRYGDLEMDASTEELPSAVAQWAFGPHYFDTNPSIEQEFYDDDGNYDPSSDTLAELNDGGRSFIEIANLIKEHL